MPGCASSEFTVLLRRRNTTVTVIALLQFLLSLSGQSMQVQVICSNALKIVRHSHVVMYDGDRARDLEVWNRRFVDGSGGDKAFCEAHLLWLCFCVDCAGLDCLP